MLASPVFVAETKLTVYVHNSGVPTVPVKAGVAETALFSAETVILKPSAGGVGGVKALLQLSAILRVIVRVADDAFDQVYSKVTIFVPTCAVE